MGLAGYTALNFPTPESLREQYDGYSVLIIGSGTSTKKLLQYKSEIRKRFDIVIGVNFTTRDFEDIMDFHMIMEIKPITMANEMAEDYRKDLPRVFNYKSIKYFPKDMTIIKARREHFFGTPDVTKYHYKHAEGLLEHRQDPQKKRKIYYGTVTLQAMHFACILGCKKIYLIGADLMFKDEYDHYYEDKFYREPVTPSAKRSALITARLGGELVPTTHVFNKSAKVIDKTIVKQCRPKGIEVYDFSEGLIKRAVPLNVDEFFAEEVE